MQEERGKSAGKRDGPRTPKRWDVAHMRYSCADGAEICVPGTAFQHFCAKDEGPDAPEGQKSSPERPERKSVLRYGIAQKRIDRGQRLQTRLFICGALLSRDTTVLERGPETAKTVAFPNTTREILDGAFAKTALRSIVLNEGLERIGGRQEDDGGSHEGAFCSTQIKKIALPSTLKLLGDYTFSRCENLGQVASRRKTQDGAKQEEL